MIEIEDLTYIYPDGKKALENINLKIIAGEKVVILGANGAGKSTLLLHLNGLLRGSGKVTIAGIEIGPKNLKEIRRKVGMVFQNPDDQLFCPTVYDDIAFGLRNLGFDENLAGRLVKKALHEVGLDGFDERSAHHLSFGQKRRTAIATVLAMAPEIIVLDEPTSNLDPKGKRRIKELLKKIGGTQVIVTHDLLNAAELAERVVVLAEGRVFADGPSEKILADEDLLRNAGLW